MNLFRDLPLKMSITEVSIRKDDKIWAHKDAESRIVALKYLASKLFLDSCNRQVLAVSDQTITTLRIKYIKKYGHYIFWRCGFVLFFKFYGSQ